VKYYMARRGRPAGRTHNRATAPVIVKVAEVGGAVKEVCLNGTRHVSDALAAADFADKAMESVKVNGETATEEMNLENGDIITISKKTSYGAL
jgi:hypothetical protein